MSMHVDGKKITAMYWGGQKIREAWYEGRRVFSSEPTDTGQVTGASYMPERGAFRSTAATDLGHQKGN